MKKLPQICCFYLLCMASMPAIAQNCCSGGVPISGNLGLPTGEPGSFQVSLSYDLNLLRKLKTGTSVEAETTIRRLRTTQSFLLSAGYTLTPRISVETFVSWVRQERTVTNLVSDSKNFQSAQGIGDVVVLGKYYVLPPDNNFTSLQLGLGAKLPTGSYEEETEGGIPLGMDLQPGSGSWDGIFWGRFTHIFASRPSMSFSLTGSYSLRTRNRSFRQLGNGTTQDWKIGDELQLLAGVADRFQLGRWVLDPSLSFRVRLAERDETNGFEMDNTGGSWLFWVPGISMAITPTISWQATGDIPLYSNISGTQLTPSFRLNTGLIFQFATRKAAPGLDLFQ